jgi:hypothetical protein
LTRRGNIIFKNMDGRCKKDSYKKLSCYILMGISQQCQSDNHQSCPTQIQVNNEQTNCQCGCHSRSDVTKSRSEVLSNEQARART